MLVRGNRPKEHLPTVEPLKRNVLTLTTSKRSSLFQEQECGTLCVFLSVFFSSFIFHLSFMKWEGGGGEGEGGGGGEGVQWLGRWVCMRLPQVQIPFWPLVWICFQLSRIQLYHSL